MMAPMVLAAASQPASQTPHLPQGGQSSLLPLPMTPPPQAEVTASQPTLTTKAQVIMCSLQLTASLQPATASQPTPVASRPAVTPHPQLLLLSQPAAMASLQAAPAVTQAPPRQLTPPAFLPPLPPVLTLRLLLLLLVVTASHQSQVGAKRAIHERSRAHLPAEDVLSSIPQAAHVSLAQRIIQIPGGTGITDMPAACFLLCCAVLAPAAPIATIEPNQEALTAFTGSDTTAAADAIVQASGNGGDSASAAGASMAQAMQAGDTQAVADATAAAAARDPAATANVLAAAQTQAVARGATEAYARSTAQAFSAAASQGTTQQLTEAFAQVGCLVERLQ
jgi:hypothetical protein